MAKKIEIGIFAAVTAVLAFLIIRFVLPVIIAIAAFGYGMFTTKPVIVSDVQQYQTCFGDHSDEEYGVSFDGLFQVFPQEIAEGATVKEFQFMYYNPFDPQRIAYMTVEPKGYHLIVMDSDTYSGFGYAMIPEEENNTITYVGISFCNYFLDVDVHEYVPDGYLLPGFDATSENPYLKKKLNRK